MAKVNPRDFLLNTDYEMDKIIYFKDGELSAGQSQSIAHKLSFIPLVFGVCAFNSDFSDPRTLPFQQITRDNTISFDLRATATNIQIGYGNYADNPPKMLYRIYGFEPSNSHAKVGSTIKNAKQFILNTDYNYCKLYKKGFVTSGITTIDHNFGYIPQVLAWGEKSGTISPIENSTPSDPILGTPQYIAVSTTRIAFNIPNLSYDKVHYRIYYDEA